MRTPEEVSCRPEATPLAVVRTGEMLVVRADGVERVAADIVVPRNNRLLLKLEHLTRYNPTGSLYDRLYPFLLDRYQARGLLRSRDTPLLEGSVGNAAAAFVQAAIDKGYLNHTVVLPQDIFGARIDQIRALGARVIEGAEQVGEPGGKLLFSPPKTGEMGYVRLMEDILRLDARRKGKFGRDPTRIVPVTKVRRRALNPPYARLMREVLAAMPAAGLEPSIHNFVFGVGSGNTLTESGLFLKSKFGDGVRVVCCEFAEHPFVWDLKQGRSAKLEEGWPRDGMAQTVFGVPPEKLNVRLDMIDDVLLMDPTDRAEARRVMNDALCLHAGRTSGLMVSAAIRLAEQVRNQTILTIIFDSTSKYQEVYNPLFDIDLSSGRAIVGDGRVAPASAVLVCPTSATASLTARRLSAPTTRRSRCVAS